MDPRKRVSKSYKPKNYHERVCISQLLNKDDHANKRTLLQKWYEMINTEEIPWEAIKIRGLELFRIGIEVTLQKGLQIEVCLLVVQCKVSVQQRLKQLNFTTLHAPNLVFVTETWLHLEIEDSEVFQLKCNSSIIARRDRLIMNTVAFS